MGRRKSTLKDDIKAICKVSGVDAPLPDEELQRTLASIALILEGMLTQDVMRVLSILVAETMTVSGGPADDEFKFGVLACFVKSQLTEIRNLPADQRPSRPFDVKTKTTH